MPEQVPIQCAPPTTLSLHGAQSVRAFTRDYDDVNGAEFSVATIFVDRREEHGGTVAVAIFLPFGARLTVSLEGMT